MFLAFRGIKIEDNCVILPSRLIRETQYSLFKQKYYIGVMKYNYHLYVSFFISFFFLSSCNGEFSKYQKKEKNDLEKNHLVGNVKSITKYFNGELADIHRYNKYGFITEYIDYNEGEIVENRTYTYNEFGKISRKETKNKECHIVEITKFDEYGNSVEESEEILEVFDTNSGMSVGKRLQYTYENNYDKMGVLISRKCFRRNGTCQIEMEYDQYGNISKRTEYDEEGSVFEYKEYSYIGNRLSEERIAYPQYHLMYSIFNYNQNGQREKWAQLYEDGSIHEVREYVFDHNSYMIKEICTWVVSMDRGNLKQGDVCHTITLYERDEHGSLLKETKMTYYPNEDMSIPKEAEETKTFEYKYDTQGNVIYEKEFDGNEYKYEITYY